MRNAVQRPDYIDRALFNIIHKHNTKHSINRNIDNLNRKVSDNTTGSGVFESLVDTNSGNTQVDLLRMLNIQQSIIYTDECNKKIY